MTDYYASDTEIAAQFFNGESVPSENTIITEKNTLFKNRAQTLVDNYGANLSSEGKKSLFLLAYGEYLKGEFVVNPILIEQFLRAEIGPALLVTRKFIPD